MSLIGKIIRRTLKPVINNAKGAVGEKKVANKLNPLIFGRVEHRQINNLVLVDKNGKSHQIDHIEIRHNGIFCIETKNYSGLLFGSTTEDYWTQTLYGQKNRLRNPIKQNLSHVYHVKEALEGRYRINSVIVLVQNNATRMGIPNVVNLKNLKDYLANFNDGTHLTVTEMDYIYEKLLSAARSDITKRDHLKSIRKTQKEIEKNICPRCGGTLKLREGQYGKFLGCINYPDCKFTKQIK